MQIDEEEHKYQNQEEILVINQAVFYQDQHFTVNKLERDSSETIFVKKFNNFIKTLLIQ